MNDEPRERLNMRTIEVSLRAALQGAATPEERDRIREAGRVLYVEAREDSRSPDVVAAIDERIDALERPMAESSSEDA